MIDDPKITDNRQYDYTSHPDLHRAEYDYILDMINDNSKVVDLGCGNGTLLQLIREKKNAEVYGVEISKSGVEVCSKKGLEVIEGRIDEPMKFKENEFDFSVCNVTMQMVMFPEILLQEMKRISKYQVISFPNFAFYKNRLDLLFNGVMPRPMLFNYKWYSTGHIHQFSIKDFYSLVNHTGGLKVIQHNFVKADGSFRNNLMKLFPNLFQSIPIFLLKKDD